MFEGQDEAGIGVVVQNSLGEVMAAQSEKIKKPSSVEILEMLAQITHYLIEYVDFYNALLFIHILHTTIMHHNIGICMMVGQSPKLHGS